MANKVNVDVSRAYKLDSIIEYQEGSVVSRTVVDKESGTLTVFAFDREQGLSTHQAPFDAVVQVLDGTAEIVIGEETFTMSAGEMVVMPAGVPHSLKAVERFKMLLIMIREK